MLSAKAIKELNSEGFDVLMPSAKKEEIFEEIFLENSSRLDLALPLLFSSSTFDYSFLRQFKSERLSKILAISKKIFEIENIESLKFDGICSELGLIDFSSEEFDYFYSNFKEFRERKLARDKLNLDLRLKVLLNKDLSKLFSLAKQRILNKIYSHEILTNTELKYYYRSIRPLIKILLNDSLRDYARVIDGIKPKS